MARTLSPIWLFAAILYTAGTLLFVQSDRARTEPGSIIIPINETLKAKQTPAKAARAELPPLPRPDIKHLQLGQWVQVARYTAVLRAFPGTPGHVLGGYPVGEPFRVVSLDGDNVRVQDLASGHFGWMQKSDLIPYTDGYRPRRVIFATQVAAATPAVTPPHVAEHKVAAAVPVKPVTASQVRPYTLGPAPAETPVSTKPEPRKPLRVALDDAFGSILQRAFSGAH